MTEVGPRSVAWYVLAVASCYRAVDAGHDDAVAVMVDGMVDAPSAGHDEDGDGVPDGSDNCPTIPELRPRSTATAISASATPWRSTPDGEG